MLAGQIFMYAIIGLFCVAVLIVIINLIIDSYNIPVHRLIRYRIVKRHSTFDCLGKIGEYYMFYIQEKKFIEWRDVDDKHIPIRRDGELLYSKKQRHDNYFESFKNADKCLKDLIEKRELNHQIKKAKKEDEVIDEENK